MFYSYFEQAYFIRPSSGTEFAHWGLNEANQEPEEYIKQTAEQVDCPVSDSQEMVDCLKTKAREELEETTMECKVHCFSLEHYILKCRNLLAVACS